MDAKRHGYNFREFQLNLFENLNHLHIRRILTKYFLGSGYSTTRCDFVTLHLCIYTNTFFQPPKNKDFLFFSRELNITINAGANLIRNNSNLNLKSCKKIQFWFINNLINISNSHIKSLKALSQIRCSMSCHDICVMGVVYYSTVNIILVFVTCGIRVNICRIHGILGYILVTVWYQLCHTNLPVFNQNFNFKRLRPTHDVTVIPPSEVYHCFLFSGEQLYCCICVIILLYCGPQVILSCCQRTSWNQNKLDSRNYFTTKQIF